MLEIPMHIYQFMFVLFSSAIPVLIMLVIIRMIVKSGRKTYDSFRP